MNSVVLSCDTAVCVVVVDDDDGEEGKDDFE